LPGRFRFGILDRADNAIVFQLAEKFFRSHLSPTRAGASSAKTCAAAAASETAETSATSS
jgi:hypothetical protein